MMDYGKPPIESSADVMYRRTRSNVDGISSVAIPHQVRTTVSDFAPIQVYVAIVQVSNHRAL
jgi:hypothetical protein